MVSAFFFFFSFLYHTLYNAIVKKITMSVPISVRVESYHGEICFTQMQVSSFFREVYFVWRCGFVAKLKKIDLLF